MKVRLNGFFNTLVDINMSNGFNRELANIDFEDILDKWIEVKPNIMSQPVFQDALLQKITDMMNQYF